MVPLFYITKGPFTPVRLLQKEPGKFGPGPRGLAETPQQGQDLGPILEKMGLANFHAMERINMPNPKRCTSIAWPETSVLKTVVFRQAKHA